MKLYTINPYNKRNFNLAPNQPFWYDKHSAALNADSHPLSDIIDSKGEWVCVHEVELVNQDLNFFKHNNSDDHIYFENLEIAKEPCFFYDLSIGRWSFRLFQHPSIQNRLKDALFGGFTSKMNDTELLTIFDASNYKWRFTGKAYDYTDLIEDYDKRKGLDGGMLVGA